MTILEYDDYARKTHFSADVVVIGTGAGGAACGAELAEAGLDVLFIEEGAHHPTSSFNPYVTESVPRLYRDASATIIMGNPPIPFVEGRCVGGSTVLNGGMTWRAPEKILEDWERITGQPDLGQKALEPIFRQVEERVSAKPQIEASIGEDNRIMAEGARRLGWRYQPNHRNQDRCVGANSCVVGCPTGAKQSTLVTYMPRALKAGARALTELKAESLLIENGRCVGVMARGVNPRTRKPDRSVTVRAKAVVVAGGAIQTPGLLLKHKLGRPSKQLGKNFLCHPNAKVLAVYDRPIRAWEGVSQGGQVREFHDDGIVFAENFIPPGALAAQIPWHGKGAWDLMQDYDRMVLTGVLVEDSRPGTVTTNFLSGPVAQYDVTPLDHRRFLKGIKALATLHFEMGAARVILPFSNLHEARSVDDLKRIDETQRGPSTMDLFTVHLMGTARMGSRREQSVVDLTGELWDLPGCYVADASLFPTAIGVNPQITIMALATLVAQRLGDKVRAS